MLIVNSAGMLLSLVLFVAGPSVSEVKRRIQLVRGGAGPQIQLVAMREWCDECGRPGPACVRLLVCRRTSDGRIADSDRASVTYFVCLFKEIILLSGSEA